MIQAPFGWYVKSLNQLPDTSYWYCSICKIDKPFSSQVDGAGLTAEDALGICWKKAESLND